MREAGRPRPASRLPWLLWTTAAAWVALDQLTKALIVAAMPVGESVRVLGPVLSFTRRTNTGGAFGMLPGNALLLGAVGALVTVFLAIHGPRLVGRTPAALLSLGLVVGGALGNLIDRSRLGHVVDFIDVHCWPVFNVADMGITVGFALILLLMLWDRGLQDAAPPPAAED